MQEIVTHHSPTVIMSREAVRAMFNDLPDDAPDSLYDAIARMHDERFAR